MTVVLDSSSDGARTHALIIGVGTYRHLPSGQEPRLAKDYGLEQLTSPPISARAFADWLAKDYRNPDAPLGSIDMLLSEAVPRPYVLPGGKRFDPDPATWKNIQSSFDSWYEKCNLNEESVALFFFCGHGVMKENLALLPDDFGKRKQSPFADTIDFEGTYRGMKRCAARTQCYFIDSCRQIPYDVLNEAERLGNPLISPNVRVKRRRSALDAPIIYASANQSSAYGRRDGTKFTKALLACLAGYGAKRLAGKWVITTDRLGQSVRRQVERENRRGGPPQNCECDGVTIATPIHFLRAPPEWPVTVSLRPRKAEAEADMSLVSQRNRRVQARRTRKPGDWETHVPPDIYNVFASFKRGTYRDTQSELWANEPYVEEVMTVTA